MSVGLLLITHGRIGEALLQAATATLMGCPLAARVLAVAFDGDPAGLLARARALAAEVDRGEGVLVLTDMFGSTPSNIANRLLEEQRPVIVIAGLSLPMLIRILNYPGLGLAELADKAVSAGYDGIVSSTQGGPC